MPTLATPFLPAGYAAPSSAYRVFDDWGNDAFDFLRHQAPKILAILVVAFILARLLRFFLRNLGKLGDRDSEQSTFRSQQLRTLSGVSYSIGILVVASIAGMQILALLGINMGPLLASAGVVGLAIGFGAQTLVKDFINGFFILAENQYDIGDTVRIAGVQGVVENVTLRRTVLRDSDGTVHTVPSSEIKVVSNLTRDWTQINMKVSVAYSAPSDRVTALLKQTAEGLAKDPNFAELIVSAPLVHGIDKVMGNTADYLLSLKTRPGSQDVVRRELQTRIKVCLEQNNIAPGDHNRLTIAPPGSTTSQK
jgi:moderate conductance mechanosensitive channel